MTCSVSASLAPTWLAASVRICPGLAEVIYSWVPLSEKETELRKFLAHRYRQVGWEHVASDRALSDLYAFELAEANRPLPDWLRTDSSPGQRVAQLAQSESNGLANTAVTQWLSFYGRAVGNLALTLDATGGVWLVAGYAPRHPDAMLQLKFDRMQAWRNKTDDGPFLTAFRETGPDLERMLRMPVRVILETPLKMQLRGAAQLAYEHIQ